MADSTSKRPSRYAQQTGRLSYQDGMTVRAICRAAGEVAAIRWTRRAWRAIGNVASVRDPAAEFSRARCFVSMYR